MPSKKTAKTDNVKLSDVPGVADTAAMAADQLSPATDVAASGAFIEPEIVERVDTSHPAVDNAPRKDQPAVSNQIDFNDPTVSEAEAVEHNLAAAAGAAAKSAD